jgi:hypothetical protein
MHSRQSANIPRVTQLHVDNEEVYRAGLWVSSIRDRYFVVLMAGGDPVLNFGRFTWRIEKFPKKAVVGFG